MGNKYTLHSLEVIRNLFDDPRDLCQSNKAGVIAETQIRALNKALISFSNESNFFAESLSNVSRDPFRGILFHGLAICAKI